MKNATLLPVLLSLLISPVFAQEQAEVPADSTQSAPAPAEQTAPVENAAPAEDQAGSIFVQDPALFHQRQADLEKLKGSLENANEGLDSLLDDATRMAKMNDQCAAVSINDVMGDECWAFYQVELPAFEERYMRVTGEVRLGHMEMARGLADRKLQIDACVDALHSLASSKDQFLNLAGNVFVEPLSKGFQANYDFTLQYEPNHRKNAFAIAQKWGETCREMVVRQDGKGFAPYFLERLEALNAELSSKGSLAVYKTDSSSALTVFLDVSKPIRSAYYLNGVKLFHSRLAAGSVNESNLRIAFDGTSVAVDGAEKVYKYDGTPASYAGSVDFPNNATNLKGRWYWENKTQAAAENGLQIDFGPEFDEDSLAVAKVAEAQAAADSAAQKAVDDSIAVEKRRGVKASFFAAITGAGLVYDNVAAHGYDLEEKDLFLMPDVAVAARAKFNFGETADAFLALGAGGMLGFGIGKDLDKVYVAPLVQFEIGYKFVGFRETAIFPIAGSDEEQWFQFRSGAFFTFGMFGVEVGHSLVTDMGNGAYLSVFFGL
jgi:hypothetical protein